MNGEDFEGGRSPMMWFLFAVKSVFLILALWGTVYGTYKQTTSAIHHIDSQYLMMIWIAVAVLHFLEMG